MGAGDLEVNSLLMAASSAVFLLLAFNVAVALYSDKMYRECISKKLVDPEARNKNPFYSDVIVPFELAKESLFFFAIMVAGLVLCASVLLALRWFKSPASAASFFITAFVLASASVVYLSSRYVRGAPAVSASVREWRRGYRMIVQVVIVAQIWLVAISYLAVNSTSTQYLKPELVPVMGLLLMAVSGVALTTSFFSGFLKKGTHQQSQRMRDVAPVVVAKSAYLSVALVAVVALVASIAFEWTLRVEPSRTIFDGFGRSNRLAIALCSALSGAGLLLVWKHAVPLVKTAVGFTKSISVRRFLFAGAGATTGYLALRNIPEDLAVWIALAWLLLAIPLSSLLSKLGSQTAQIDGICDVVDDQYSEFSGLLAAVSALPLVAGFIAGLPGLSRVSLYLAVAAIFLYFSRFLTKPSAIRKFNS